MADKIINTFQQRRQLAQELNELGQTTTELELQEVARRLAQTYPADLLVATLVKYLDTTNSQLRGGLGHLATLLPPEEVGPALRAAAANRQHSAQTRLTAALLLERFLGETLPPGLLGDLSQTNEVALQSLREAVDEGRRNRHILLEYVSQMYQAGEAVPYMVLDLLEQLPPGDRAELYRLIAQGERPQVARTALQRLERLATADHEPGAIRALHTLQFTLPPEPAAQAERTLRKLAFTGARYTPPTPTGWRALLSPTDIGGSYSMWLVQTPPTNLLPGTLIGLVLNPLHGILQTFASETMPRDQLPSPRPVGQLVSVRTDNGGTAVLLEAPFDFCRRRLLAAHAAHWQATPNKPMPEEYQLYQDRIWEFDPPQPDPALAVYFEDEGTPTAGELDETALDQAAAQLLAHPAMSGWTLHNRLFLQTFAPTGATLDRIGLAELTAHVLRELARRPESEQLVTTMAAGLRSQAAWLHIAGDAKAAERAHLLARALPVLPFPQNPFLAHLINKSLRAAGIVR